MTGTPRQRRILHALCREYVLTGSAVSSGRLQKRHRLEWSSATIRSELACLEQQGLVHKPHQASGRVPTRQGMLAYIDHLPRAQDPRPEHQRVLALTEDWSSMEGLRSTAKVLADLAGCVAISLLAGSRPGVLEGIEIVPIGDARAFIAATTAEGSTLHMVALDEAVAQGEGLRRVQAHLRELTVGRTLAQARARLGDLMKEQQARLDEHLGQALRLGLLLCGAMGLEPLWVHVAGHASLLKSENRDTSLPELLGLLEDYEQLAEILAQLLPEASTAPRAAVHLGFEPTLGDAGRGATGGPDPATGYCLVGCRLPSASALGSNLGALAVVGPARMDYESVIPLVEYAARATTVRGDAQG